MSHEDFTLDSLSRYLHLAPQQVLKLTERGRLPGRKVSGEWRFANAEIHHWLEHRLGLGDDERIVDVEQVLRASGPGDADVVSLVSLMPLEAVAVPLAARTRNSVIDVMCDLATRTGLLWDARAMADAVRLREELHSTAMENGVALLHPRRPMPQILGDPILALGCTSSGIPFGQDVPLSDVFFLICSVDDRSHLRTLSRLSRMLTTPGFLNALHQADDAAAARQVVIEFDALL